MIDNELIAEFMDGITFDAEGVCTDHERQYSWRPDCYDRLRVDHLQYHNNWNWLMPVVEKIESIYDEFHGYFGVHINSNSCVIQGTNLRTDPENFHPAYFADYTLGSKIESTYAAIVGFIKWYKQLEL